MQVSDQYVVYIFLTLIGLYMCKVLSKPDWKMIDFLNDLAYTIRHIGGVNCE